MTPREIEKTIEFLLQHQAVVEVRQDRSDGLIARLVEQNRVMSRQATETDRHLSSRIDMLADSVGALKDACRDLLDPARWADSRIRRLEEPEG